MSFSIHKNISKTDKNTENWIIPLIIFSLIQFGTMSDNSLLSNAFSALAFSFNTTMDKLQFANMVYPLIGGSFMIAAGFIGANIGWRRLLLIGLVIISLGEILAIFSPNITVFTYGARLLAGIGGSFCIPALLGYITFKFTKKQISLSFGVIAAVTAIGSALAPIISGLVIVAFNWQVGFLLLLIIFLVSFILVFLCVEKDNLAANNVKFDLIGFILLFFGLSGLLIGISQTASWGFLLPISPPFTILGVSPCLFIIGFSLILLAYFLHYETTREAKLGLESVLVPKLFLHNKAIRAGILLSAFVFFILGALGFILVLYMQVVFLKNAIMTGLYLAIFAAGMAISSIFTPIICEKFSIKLLCRYGISIVALSMIVVAYGIKIHGLSIWFYLGLFLVGLGLGVVASQASFAVTSAIADSNLASKSSGIQASSRNIGQAFGIALIGLTLMFGLTASIKLNVNHSAVLPNTLKVYITDADSIPFISNPELQTYLDKSHIDKNSAKELININESGRLVAIRATLSMISVISILFLFMTGGLLSTKLKDLKKE
ncbi:MFS transporter [Thiotrichales bacterium 19S3-7]|nr:MFS transporter [Thiotrichales bacterium 19S3-7]MCF6801868.1 MFS transporter [Thiotrichales bacterium 19S3-11]